MQDDVSDDLLRQGSGQAFNLQRFVDAQAGGVYEQALGEIKAGQKRSHWMWFIFPTGVVGPKPDSEVLRAFR
jgi:uncharacterized protein (DUF1810 family)